MCVQFRMFVILENIGRCFKMRYNSAPLNDHNFCECCYLSFLVVRSLLAALFLYSALPPFQTEFISRHSVHNFLDVC